MQTHEQDGHDIIDLQYLQNRVGILKYLKKSKDGLCIKAIKEDRYSKSRDCARLRGTVIGSDCAKDAL